MTRVRLRIVGFVALALTLVTMALIYGLRDVGDDSPEQAVYALAHAIEHRDAEGACERLISVSSLPERTRIETGLAGMQALGGRCHARLESQASFEAFGFEDALVSDVQEMPDARDGEIATAARVRVRLEEGRTAEVVTVRAPGGWRVVEESARRPSQETSRG